MSVGNLDFDILSDKLGRYTGRKVSNYPNDILSESIEYKEECISSNKYRQSNLPEKITYNDGSYISYTYDASGNITNITYSNGKKIRYMYDELDRLIREDNGVLNKSYTYSYVSNGIVYNKKEYAYSTGNLTTPIKTTQYGHSVCKLTNDGTYDVVYDAMGNPTQYKGKTLTWEKGKRLTAFGENTFEYDGRGRRIKKNGVRYYYDYEDKLIASGDGIQYFYDIIGVAGFKYNGAYYTYKRDIQNNVTGILDNNGNQVVQYDYDAWGNHTVTDTSENGIGTKNPFRYRSYFYDTETGLYFLKTRYYDPETCRFLSPDSFQYADPNTANGLNLYAYCCNNPVNNVDPDGHVILTILSIFATLAVGALVGGVVGGVASAVSGGDFWAGFAGGVVSGLISTIGMSIALATGGIGGLLIAGAAGFIAGMSGSIVEQGIERGWGNINLTEAAISGGISALFNVISFGAMSFAMRNSVGLFENIVDKSIKITARILNALKFSPEAYIMSVMFSMPVVLANGIVTSFINLSKKGLI